MLPQWTCCLLAVFTSSRTHFPGIAFGVQAYPFQRSFFSPYAWSAQYELTVLLPQQQSQFYLFGYTNDSVSMGSTKFTVHYATGIGWGNPLPENTPTRKDFLLGHKF